MDPHRRQGTYPVRFGKWDRTRDNKKEHHLVRSRLAGEGAAQSLQPSQPSQVPCPVGNFPL